MITTRTFRHPKTWLDCTARYDGELLTVEADEPDDDADWDDSLVNLMDESAFRSAAGTVEIARRELHALGVPVNELERTEARS